MDFASSGSVPLSAVPPKISRLVLESVKCRLPSEPFRSLSLLQKTVMRELGVLEALIFNLLSDSRGSVGTKLAHFTIAAHLGSGGIGNVYQATDSKLGRNVAIQLSPETIAPIVDRLRAWIAS
jgi:hypothetical protein